MLKQFLVAFAIYNNLHLSFVCLFAFLISNPVIIIVFLFNQIQKSKLLLLSVPTLFIIYKVLTS